MKYLSDRWARSFPLGAMIVFVVALVALSASNASAGPTFAGVPLPPGGGMVQANVPLSDLEKSYVAEGGNAVPSHAVAVLAVPPGFDPNKMWPVMVAFASSEHGHQNAFDLRMIWQHYLQGGWIGLAGDGPTVAPRVDSSGWRAGHTLAALDALHRSFPGSRQWPIVLVGQSGGAKRASYLAPLFAVGGYRVAGLFLTGINEERITEGCRRFKPPRGFFGLPIFLSSGDHDRIATPDQQLAVENSMRRTGFTNIQHMTFAGGHEGSEAHVFEALRWFRSGMGDHPKGPSAKP